MANDSKRYAMVCKQCGSDEVSREARADWNAKKQEWMVGAVFDYAHCHKCDCETSLIEFELAAAHI